MTPMYRASLLVLLSAVVLLAYACGDDETSGEPAASFPAGAGGGDDAGVQQFDISLRDNTFEAAEFTLSGGVIVKFNIANPGAAIHNMRLAGADNVYNNEDDVVSEPTLVNGGETAVLEWATPVAGGTFDFRCDFHPDAMVGTITVQPAGEETGAGGEGP